MEQRHLATKSHWYHETQSRHCPKSAQPRGSAAAPVNDPLLLDYPVPAALTPVHHQWLAPARALARLLFPAQAAVTRLHTLTSYDRLSTALTVAQVYGVQRLCNYYATQLAPQPGPDSSRESNQRLTQITQFARQLATHPSHIDNAATRQLLAVGLSDEDVITFHHIIGFVGFQARLVAALQALNGQPIRWLPGMEAQRDASMDGFANVPQAHLAPSLTPLSPALATSEQAALVAATAQSDALFSLAWTLVREPQSWTLLNGLRQGVLLTGVNHHWSPLVSLISARINGSPACFSRARDLISDDNTLVESVRNGDRSLQAWSQGHIQVHPQLPALLDAILVIIRAPTRLGAPQIDALTAQGISPDEILLLLARTGLEGWINRLNIGLYGQS